MHLLQVLQHAEAFTNRRIQQLQKNIDNGALSLTQQTQAKLELAELQSFQVNSTKQRHRLEVQLKVAKSSDLLDETQRTVSTTTSSVNGSLQIVNLERIDELEALALLKDGKSPESPEEDSSVAAKADEPPTKEIDLDRTVITSTSTLSGDETTKADASSPVKEIDLDQKTVVTSTSTISGESTDEPDTKKLSKIGRDSSLRKQISSLSQEACDRSVSRQKLKTVMDIEHEENTKRNKELMKYVGENLESDHDRTDLLNHWEFKSTKLSMKCLSAKGDNQDKALQELENYKLIQDERMSSLKEERSIAFNELSSLKDHKRFSKRASLDPSFRGTLQRVVRKSSSVVQQIREEAKVEMMAVEECLAIDYHAEPKRELVVLKEIVSTLSNCDDDNTLVYLLSCGNCTNYMNFVGITETDIKTAVEKHFDQVVNKLIKKSSSGNSNGNSGRDNKKKDANHSPDPREAWSKDFAQHFAKHYQQKAKKMRNITEADIIRFCQDNMMIEVLKRQDGTELYWEEYKAEPSPICDCNEVEAPANEGPKVDDSSNVVAKKKKSRSKRNKRNQTKEGVAEEMPYTTPFGMSGWYTGEMAKGRPHGVGTMKFQNGIVYEGSWKNGYTENYLRNKKRMTKGKFIRNIKSMKGKKFFKKSKKAMKESKSKVDEMPYTTTYGMSGWYTGDVNSKGIPNGFGTMKYQNGCVFSGYWKNGHTRNFLRNKKVMKKGL